MKLAIVEKKTFLAGLQCTLTSSCAKTEKSTKFAQNQPFVTFSIFVPEKIQKKHQYKLD